MSATEESLRQMADTVRDPFLSKVCADLDGPDKNSAKTRNKDLAKTKLCMYFVQGKCGLGTNCQFAHSASEVRTLPNFTKTQLCTNFMNGKCMHRNCNYAHGEAELVKPPSFKKKPCVWFKQGKCRNGVNCGFIHDLSEFGGEGDPFFKESQQKPRKTDCEVDSEASTEVPSSESQSQVGSDITTRSTAPVPEEHLFRMMAGRGSAPLQQQVKSMALAIGDLQAKLSQVQGRRQAASNASEGEMFQKQVDEMQQAIRQLSKRCEGMEAHLHAKQQPAPPVPQPSFNKARSNASASRQKAPGITDRSDDITRLPPVAKKVRPATQSSLVKHSKGSHQFGMRAALCVVVVALMVMLELNQYRSA